MAPCAYWRRCVRASWGRSGTARSPKRNGGTQRCPRSGARDRHADIPGDAVGTGESAEVVVEGVVLLHQHHEVLDRRGWAAAPPQRARRRQASRQESATATRRLMGAPRTRRSPGASPSGLRRCLQGAPPCARLGRCSARRSGAASWRSRARGPPRRCPRRRTGPHCRGAPGRGWATARMTDCG